MSKDKPAPDQPDKGVAAVQRKGREDIYSVFRSEGGNEFSGEHHQRLPVSDTESLSGPSVSRAMEDATIHRDSEELLDADGPSRRREMLDSVGPLVARRLDGSYGPINQTDPADMTRQSSSVPPDARTAAGAGPHMPYESAATPGLPSTVHLQTFAINMEDRLAQMKASQKETLEKMRQLEQMPEESDPTLQGKALDEARRNDVLSDNSEERRERPLQQPAGASALRHILTESRIHPAIRQSIAHHHRDLVDEVIQATLSHRCVVVGMAGNPVVAKARKLLQSQAIDHWYLQYGGYFSQWRRRNALKMWTGWPTFPMVFIDGMLIGGYQDLKTLLDSGELQPLLENQAAAK